MKKYVSKDGKLGCTAGIQIIDVAAAPPTCYFHRIVKRISPHIREVKLFGGADTTGFRRKSQEPRQKAGA